MSTDVAETEGFKPVPFNPDEDAWAEAIAQADTVEGADKSKGAALVSVPFLITRVFYRDGVQRPGVKYRDDYASVELTVAPAKVVANRAERGHLDPTTLQVSPGEAVVLNDGSTGIYRQVTQYLVAKGLIELPDGPASGGKGECVFDLPRSQWRAGAEAATSGIPIRLFCPRGLRASDYTNDYNPDGSTTYYIA